MELEHGYARLEARLQSLETTMHRWRRSFFGLLGTASLIVGVAVAQPRAIAGPESSPADVVRAHRFELVSQNGHRLATLAGDSDPFLSFYGQTDKTVLAIGSGGGAAQLSMYDEREKPQVVLIVGPQSPRMELWGKGGEKRIELDANDTLSNRIVIYGPHRVPRAAMIGEPDGAAGFYLLDENMKPTWSATGK